MEGFVGANLRRASDDEPTPAEWGVVDVDVPKSSVRSAAAFWVCVNKSPDSRRRKSPVYLCFEPFELTSEFIVVASEFLNAPVVRVRSSMDVRTNVPTSELSLA